MPLLLFALAAAGLGIGTGAFLAGSGAQKIASSATQVAVLGSALYLGYVVLSAKRA